MELLRSASGLGCEGNEGMVFVQDSLGSASEAERKAASKALAGSRLLIIAVAVLVLCRFVLAATAELAEDEAYYWLWSTHLDIGYYDHPPMIAYWIRAGTTLFGNTAFGVRFACLLGTLAGSYFLYRASLALFADRSAALLCVVWMNATLMGNAAALLATPDTPLAFFATITVFALAKLVQTGRGAWWYAAGAALGAAFASKYTAALLAPCILLWMAALPGTRRWFLRPEPYIGAALALAIVSPVLLWNYSHDWASFAKQAAHGIKDRPADALSSVMDLIGGQAGLASPLILVFCIVGSAYAFIRGLRRQDQRWLLLGAITAPLFAFFLIHAASQKIQPNWPGLIYPGAILAAVHSFLEIPAGRSARRPLTRAAFEFAPWLGVAFTVAAFVQLGAGALPLDAKKDPTSRLKGWSKLASEIEQLELRYGAEFLLTDRYALTGELAFYSGKPERVAQINERIRYAALPAPDEAALAKAPALLVLRRGGSPGQVASSYSSVSFAKSVVREGGRNPRDAYDVYVLEGYRGGLFPPTAAGR